jgi:hypothetical protein
MNQTPRSPQQNCSTLLSCDGQSLKAFVRTVLGCGCPEEVFERMVCHREFPPGGTGPRIWVDIGGRLLVAMAAEDSVASEAGFTAFFEEGKARRDRQRFNRCRLVVATEQPEEFLEKRNGLFERLRNGDAKIHLHGIAPADLPDTLPAALQPSQPAG